jgi:hypothetical protein
MDDRISKAVTGRYFPFKSTEVAVRLNALGFATHFSDKRPSILLENCTVECVLGHQLCSLLRRSYVAEFSLPQLVPVNLAKTGYGSHAGEIRSH